jgi:hypothetical protein
MKKKIKFWGILSSIGAVLISLFSFSSDLAQLTEFNIINYIKEHEPNSYIIITLTLIILFLLIYIIKVNANNQEINNDSREERKQFKDPKDKNDVSVVKSINEKSEDSGVYEVVKRFISIFENHGIKQNQIYSFIDKKFGLNFRDFKNYDCILNILNDEILNWTCGKFGIRREWLDGTDNDIYPYKDYYLKVHLFIKDVCEIISRGQELEMFAFKFGNLVLEEDNDQYIVLLLRYPIANLNSKIIYKYIPISTVWNWGYFKSRYRLKCIFYFCNKLNINVLGYDLEGKKKESIASGGVFPEKIISKIPISITWYPEDYIDLPTESIQAKEVEETKEIREFIKEQGYIKLLNECIKNKKSDG